MKSILITQRSFLKKKKLDLLTTIRVISTHLFIFSNFKESLVLSVDGAGEIESIKIGYFDQNKKFHLFKKQLFPHSLGFFYSTITQFLGFEPENHEYKVMGMAAFGNKYLEKEMQELIIIDDKLFFRLNMQYFTFNIQSIKDEFGTQKFFNNKLITLLGNPRKKGESLSQHHFNIAFSVQKRFEEIIKKIVNYGIKKQVQKIYAFQGLCA